MKLGIATRLACLLAGEPVPNEDPVTGIHFGVISSNDDALNQEAVDDIFRHGKDLDVEERVEDEIEKVASLIMKWAVEGYPSDPESEIKDASFHADANSILPALHSEIKQPWIVAEVRQLVTKYFGRDTFLDEVSLEPTVDNNRILYEKDGYSILKCRDGDMFVQKSPWVALRGWCSPCAPNAAHHKSAGDVLTYVLGVEWFEEGKIPYECKPANEVKPT